MSKNRDKTSSQGNSKHLIEEDGQVSSTQMTTVLGDYVTPSLQSAGKNSPFLLIVLVLMVMALLGVGGYIYLQQNQISQTQSRFGELQSQVAKVSSAATLVLSGKNETWAGLNTQAGQFKNLWADLHDQGYLSNVEPRYIEFNSHVNNLQASKDAYFNAVSAVANNNAANSTVWEALSIVQQRISLIAITAGKLNAEVQAEEDQGLSAARQTLQILGIVALIIGALILLLGLIAIRKMGADKQGRSTEMGQLSSLVEDLRSEAEQQRYTAQEQVAAARRVNEANQAAILRLMNELQNLAEGDLTQQATVTEDITGAIADSVNYTMEELRNLVSQVQSATELVSKTTAVVEATSTELLASSDEQLREIRETGQAVLDVAARINNVSTQAQQSATVARQSLDAAEKGMLAVQNAIGGMNTIRDQIQDTSKRIKRLVESSQEIGEITDLIADITEQTNVLALNAAIQAASAGEAGRGFSVVAEEVQRLAERSAAATRQIAALIRTIQGDMQDAMAAMERSTRDVVEGARQSDETGTAFTEIDSVTRRLASLIQQIAEQTQNEAHAANGVAESIQHIFAVTGQTADGTRSTAQQVRELARVAEQLERSVARFRIS